MLAAPNAIAPPCFEIKSAALTLVAVALKTTDLALLAREMEARFADSPDAFDHDPVVVDLTSVRSAAEDIDFAELIALLRRHRMLPIAARGGRAEQMEEALAAGLVEAHGGAAPPARRVEMATAAEPVVTAIAAPAQPPTSVPTLYEVVQPAVPDATPAPAQRSALIVDKPLRSGQRVYAKGADLIVLAVVSYGAEVIADGNIHVYAPLRGRAAAGALGDTSARIFSTCMEPQLLSIAGIYRTTETALDAAVTGKPAQAWLDGESLVVAPLAS